MKSLKNSRTIARAMDINCLNSMKKYLELYIRKPWMFQKLMKVL
jgi:hypothetical protein